LNLSLLFLIKQVFVGSCPLLLFHLPSFFLPSSSFLFILFLLPLDLHHCLEHSGDSLNLIPNSNNSFFLFLLFFLLFFSSTFSAIDINQSIIQSINQSFNQSINHPTIQSINHHGESTQPKKKKKERKKEKEKERKMGVMVKLKKNHPNKNKNKNKNKPFDISKRK
jgi:hypothetical protein